MPSFKPGHSSQWSHEEGCFWIYREDSALETPCAAPEPPSTTRMEPQTALLELCQHHDVIGGEVEPRHGYT